MISARFSKKSRRKLIRYGLVAGNFTLLLIVGAFLQTHRSASQTIRSGTLNSATTITNSVTNPLDQFSSVQIAHTAAEMARMPEETSIHNQADSEQAMLSRPPSDATTLAKPQIVATAQKSKRDIVHYTVVNGDTLSNLAIKFGLDANSIRWSNSLTSDYLRPGASLLIPPGEGIVYQVKSADTIDGIVGKYQVNKDALISVNDAENGSLPVGDYIWLPNAQKPAPAATFNAVSSGGFVWGYGAIYDGNGYDYGYCTWWAALRRQQIGNPVPSNLGNAITWKTLAPQAGFGLGRKPEVGAVIWVDPSTMSGYWRSFGHVGFVEKINDDGSIWTSNMNSSGYASMDINSSQTGGWGRVSYKLIAASDAANFWYIY